MQTVHKHSKKREAILTLLRGTDVHPDAEWIYERLKPEIPDLSLGTVYRNLSVFKQEGTAISCGVIQGHEHFDGRVDPHPHFVCDHCGAVIDVKCDDVISELQQRISQTDECEITGHSLVFHGFCKTCRNK